jgi:hypothetical protein
VLEAVVVVLAELLKEKGTVRKERRGRTTEERR